MKYIAILTVFLLVLSCMPAVAVPVFQPVGGGNLDPADFGQWVDGKEIPVAEDAAKKGPYSVVWTSDTTPDWRGVKFGEGRAVGVRHLRIGLKKRIPVGGPASKRWLHPTERLPNGKKGPLIFVSANFASLTAGTNITGLTPAVLLLHVSSRMLSMDDTVLL